MTIFQEAAGYISGMIFTLGGGVVQYLTVNTHETRPLESTFAALTQEKHCKSFDWLVMGFEKGITVIILIRTQRKLQSR